MRQAVILAGGKGTRLSERLKGLPKPLVDIDGVPLLERQITLLRDQGFGEILVLVNYRAEIIDAFLKSKNYFGISVKCVDDGEPRGTAGAVYQALALLRSRFLVVYGDTLFNVDFDRFWKNHEDSGTAGSLFLHPNDHPHDSDLVIVDDQHRIESFVPYPRSDDDFQPNLVNAALYVLEAKLFSNGVPPGIQDFAKDFFPQCLRDGIPLNGYLSPEYIKDIGTTKRLDRAINDLRSGLVERASLKYRQRAVFLDRDGTLNFQSGYVRSPEELQLIPGADRAISILHAAEFRTVVVTNQPVVARGEVSISELKNIHGKLETVLGRTGAFLDRIYFCPHHPDSGFPGEVVSLKGVCACRKPATGMIEQACDELNLDLNKSWMIGDSTADMLAARKSGLRSVLVRTGEAGADGKYPVSPDYEFGDILEAATFIVEGHGVASRAVAPLLSRIQTGMLVRVVGRARVGKSTIAQVLLDNLRDRGFPAERLGLDAYIRSHDERDPDGGMLARFDLELARKILAPWLGGTSVNIEKPIYLRNERKRSKLTETTHVDKDAILVLEGVVSGAIDPGGRPHLLVAVIDSEPRRKTRFENEYRSRSWSPPEIENTYRQRRVDEDTLIDLWIERADFVLDMRSILGEHPYQQISPLTCSDTR
jgi:histidinol-phosphate phosphatase family protein